MPVICVNGSRSTPCFGRWDGFVIQVLRTATVHERFVFFRCRYVTILVLYKACSVFRHHCFCEADWCTTGYEYLLNAPNSASFILQTPTFCEWSRGDSNP